MKKLLCFALALMAYATYTQAQPVIEKSEVFEEPMSEGWTKMLRLKSGNTFYLHYAGKKGIEVIVWDKNKKKIAETAITGNGWNAARRRRIQICGLYEIKGEPVLFLRYYQDETPTLYRIRINPATGALVKEDFIDPQFRKVIYRQMGNFDVGQTISVEKDPGSDGYAVIFFDDAAFRKDNNIKVLHFDGNHKIVNSGTYQNSYKDYKYFSYIGAVVDADKRVFMVTWAAKNEKGKDGHVLISRLSTGDSSFTHKTLEFSKDFKNTTSDIKYDRANNRLVMLTDTRAEEKTGTVTYACFLSIIDPDNLTLKGVDIISNEKEIKYGKKAIDKDFDFSGVPQRLVINRDHSITILKESTEAITYTSTNMNNGVSHTTSFGWLNNIGIAELDAEGMAKDSYAFLKAQARGSNYGLMYMADRGKGIWNYTNRKSANDDPFMSYEYIKGNKAAYVFFNDNPKNIGWEESLTGRKMTNDADYMNTVCYTLKDGVATRSFLFGTPEGKKNTRACYIECSHYDPDTNTYTTVLGTQHGRKFESQVVWIQFQ